MNEMQVILSAALTLVGLAIGFALGRSTNGRRGTPQQSAPPVIQPEEIKPAPEPTPFDRLSRLLFDGFRKLCEPIDSALNFGALSHDDVAKRGRRAIQKFKDGEYAFRMAGGRGTGELVVARAVEMTNDNMRDLVDVLQTIARAREGSADQFTMLSYLDQLAQLSARLDEIQILADARKAVNDGIERSDSTSSEAVAGRVPVLPSSSATAEA